MYIQFSDTQLIAFALTDIAGKFNLILEYISMVIIIIMQFKVFSVQSFVQLYNHSKNTSIKYLSFDKVTDHIYAKPKHSYIPFVILSEKILNQIFFSCNFACEL